MADKDTKEFGAHVPMDEYVEFRENFPQYGATHWFINNSLREFNQMFKENPALKTLIRDSISTMLE